MTTYAFSVLNPVPKEEKLKLQKIVNKLHKSYYVARFSGEDSIFRDYFYYMGQNEICIPYDDYGGDNLKKYVKAYQTKIISVGTKIEDKEKVANIYSKWQTLSSKERKCYSRMYNILFENNPVKFLLTWDNTLGSNGTNGCIMALATEYNIPIINTWNYTEDNLEVIFQDIHNAKPVEAEAIKQFSW